MTIKRLIGSAPSQISRNKDLGTMAFQDSKAVEAEFLQVRNTASGGATIFKVQSEHPGVNMYMYGNGPGANGSLFGVTKANTQFWYTNNSTSVFGTADAFPQIFITSGAEKMRIDSAGKLLIGTTSAATPSFGDAKVTVNTGGIDGINLLAGTGSNAFNILKPYGYTNGMMLSFAAIASGNASSTVVGTISISGSTTSYATSSDYRLKENVQPMQGALDTIAQLNPVTYNWKVDGSEGQGFIAHELQAVMPGCVVGAKDAVDVNGNPIYQGIDTSFLVATLTKAIQELKAEFDEYKASHP